jgi:hypothetical protein
VTVGKVTVAVVTNPFRHAAHETHEGAKSHAHKSWLQREDAGISHGRSSLFFIAHEEPPPPSVTCLQGHEVLPGENTCGQGHPIG